jgi:hypothetical protein
MLMGLIGGGGALAGAASNPVDALATAPTGAFSASRTLLAAYGGSLYTTGASQLTWKNQVAGGSAQDLVGGSGTSPSTTTVNGLTALDASGGQFLVGTATSNYIAAGAAYIIVSIKMPASGNATNSASQWANHGIYGDGGGNWGLYIKNTSTCYAWNWDGNADSENTTSSLSASTVYVIEYRHTGGTLQSRLNNGSWSTGVATGNLTPTNSNFDVLRGWSSSGLCFLGQALELVTFSTVPSTGDQDALAANLKLYCGA